MLIDELKERTGIRYPGTSLSQDEVLAPFRARLERAEAYVLDRDAVTMGASVALSKPSSIMAALPWVRLPFNPMWIEFANADLKQAMTDLGSPNLPPAHSIATVLKSGFLITEANGVLTVEYAHRDRASNGMELADLAPSIVTFRTSNTAPDLDTVEPAVAEFRDTDILGKTGGRMRAHLKLLTVDPDEMAADQRLRDRIGTSTHPDMGEMIDAMSRFMGIAKTAEVCMDQAVEATRLFLMAILPALILINCRNAVIAETVPAPEKLNKQRRAKGKPGIVAHRVVKVRLGAARRRMVNGAGGGEDGRFVRATLVMGHFKIRRTGPFWWHPHARGAYKRGADRPTRVVTH
jgi:hypothetical protein